MEVVFYNGTFTNKDNASISSDSRSFNYGDGFFETVKIVNERLFNFSSHMERIKLALTILKLDNNYTKKFLQEIIYELITVNKMVNGTIKIHFSRSGSGRYLPESNSSDIFIRVINGELYKKNNKISLCFYEEECKSRGSLSNIKSVNSLVSVLASVYANKNGFDNAILFNFLGNIIESANANIFIVKDKKIYTPPISEGCIDGTMRRWVLNNFDVSEKVILKNEILQSDEIFITNATSGVIAVENLEEVSFSSFNKADLIQQKLINLSLGL